MYVSITIVRSILDEVRRQGVTEREFLAAADVAAEELADPLARVPLARYEQIVRVAIRLTADAGVGLHVGGSSLAASNVVGHILINCGTLRDMMALWTRYAPLVVDGTRWTLHELGERAAFRYDNDVLAPDVAAFDADGWLAFAMRFGANFTAGERPCAVRLVHAAPPRPEGYRRFFHLEPEFDAPVNEIVVRRELLDRDNLHRDDPLCELLKLRAEELLRHGNGDERFVERLRHLLRYESDVGSLVAEHVATRLGMSERSLQRRLKGRGLCLATMIEEARKEAACAAIRRADESIKELADRFGFSEPSAFHRAFKRWTGVTPAEYRRRCQRGPA